MFSLLKPEPEICSHIGTALLLTADVYFLVVAVCVLGAASWRLFGHVTVAGSWNS